MSTYQLEIKQVVDYPRCRIYRQFIRTLMKDPDIRVSGCSGLFYYTVLCSYAFRTSYKQFDGIHYTIYPGEWICRSTDLKNYLRCRTINQMVHLLESLQDRHLIEYYVLGRGKLVKYKITDWNKSNRVFEYNAPCQKDTGFFFLPVTVANELIGFGKCSEMDALLDLWIHTVYNDEEVKGSSVGPLVYLRDGTGNPLLSYETLAKRWGVSKATVGRFLKKLESRDYISLLHYEGTHGTAICIRNYLSTMFEISDVMIDKEELAFVLKIKVTVEEKDEDLQENISVSKMENSVSKSLASTVVEKVSKILLYQGFACSECPEVRYILSPLSDCKDSITLRQEDEIQFSLMVGCGEKGIFQFEVTARKEQI